MLWTILKKKFEIKSHFLNQNLKAKNLNTKICFPDDFTV